MSWGLEMPHNKSRHNCEGGDCESGPEDGHTFRITHASRGSYSVVGDEHPTDEPDFGPESTVCVRAWNLRDALHAAAELPFAELMNHEESTTSEVELMREFMQIRTFDGERTELELFEEWRAGRAQIR